MEGAVEVEEEEAEKAEEAEEGEEAKAEEDVEEVEEAARLTWPSIASPRPRTARLRTWLRHGGKLDWGPSEGVQGDGGRPKFVRN